MAKITKGKTGIKEIKFGGLKVKFVKFKNPFKKNKENSDDLALIEDNKDYLAEKKEEKPPRENDDENLRRVKSGRIRKRITNNPREEIKRKFDDLNLNLREFKEFLNELKNNGLIVEKEAQNWVREEINNYKDVKESFSGVEENKLETWKQAADQDLSSIKNQEIEFTKKIIKANLPSLYSELDKYRENINELRNNHKENKDHVKEYEFQENLQEMENFINGEIEFIDGIPKIFYTSKDLDKLKEAAIGISDTLDALKENIEENKHNFSPMVSEKEKAGYFSSKEKNRGKNNNENWSRDAG